MASSSGYNIHFVPKLEGTINFESWKVRCVSSLKSSGAWKFVEGTQVEPVKDSDEKDYQFADRLELFHICKEQARCIIVSTCNPSIQKTLAHITNAKGCWEKLLSTYSADGLLHEQEIWTRFVYCTYNGETIEDFCAKFRAAVDRCTAAGPGLSIRRRSRFFTS